MGLFLSAGTYLQDFLKALGKFVEEAIKDPNYPKMEYGGKTWEIIERQGKRLKLRRSSPRVVSFFGKRVTIYEDEILWIKRARGNVIPINPPR